MNSMVMRISEVVRKTTPVHHSPKNQSSISKGLPASIGSVLGGFACLSDS